MNYNKTEKISLYHGLASTVSTTAVNGYIPLFALSVLGASNQQMGLITSLPSIIGMIALIPGAYWLNRAKSKKNFTVLTTFATRFMFMLILFIPFLKLSFAPWILVFLIAALNFPGALSGLSWQTLIGDLIPENRRGAFFSTRNQWMTAAAMAVTFMTGFYLQQYNKTDAYPYQILLAAGFLFALVEVYYLYRHNDVKKENVTKVAEPAKRKFSMEVFRHKPFLAFIVCAVLFNIGAQMAWSLFSIYHIREAQATALWFSFFSVTNQLAQIISVKWWAKAADKHGNTMVLFVAAAGMATAPILTMLSTNLYYLTALNLWIGLFVSGTNLLLFNQLLKATPEVNRSTYLANYQFILSIIGFIAPQFGVYLLSQFGMFSAMAITSIIRLLAGCSFLLVAIKFERKQQAAEIV
ncbi:MFS transporter [Neobacillus notoginsengisoli]|uniref:MFS transporter n=1 Tax=Neobacillus notoginsengisoli TaxID=1578198 RepID=A0A417YRY7_9BACI|nr:MFS transporter [Neobacillus notoginsengisoli]RHW38056.1 MFS transporter [Neobacillus notoginsengisoli]